MWHSFIFHFRIYFSPGIPPTTSSTRGVRTFIYFIFVIRSFIFHFRISFSLCISPTTSSTRGVRTFRYIYCAFIFPFRISFSPGISPTTSSIRGVRTFRHIYCPFIFISEFLSVLAFRQQHHQPGAFGRSDIFIVRSFSFQNSFQSWHFANNIINQVRSDVQIYLLSVDWNHWILTLIIAIMKLAIVSGWVWRNCIRTQLKSHRLHTECVGYFYLVCRMGSTK